MKGEERKEQERSGEIDTAHDKSLFLLIKSLVRVGWREGEELTTGKGDIRANQRVRIGERGKGLCEGRLLAGSLVGKGRDTK